MRKLFSILLILSFSFGCSLKLKRSPLEFISLGNFLKQFFGWDRYSVGGSAKNVIGKNLKIQIETKANPETNPVIESLSITSSGNFQFSRYYSDRTTYKVSLISSPSDPTQVCEVTGSEGMINGTNTTSVGVECGEAIYVEKPDFYPPPSEYYSAQSVQITSATGGVKIYYSLNGISPDCSGSNGILYSSSVSLAGPGGPPTIASHDLRAIACKEDKSSSTERGDYTITNGLLGTPNFNIPPGIYITSQSLNLTPPGSPAGIIIHYTTDNSRPTCLSPSGTSVSISVSATVRTISCLAGYTKSAETSGYFEITGTVATPNFNITGGTFYNNQTLTLSTPTTGASIRYNLSIGSTPSNPDCSSSTLYTIPLTIDQDDTRIITIACRSGWADSGLSSQNYRLTVADPIFSPVSGDYSSNVSVSATSTTSGAIIHYRIGAGATCSDSITAPTLNITGVETVNDVYAIACKSNYTSSTNVLGNYTMTGTLPSPVFSLAAGAYGGSQSISISAGVGSPSGTGIHYTTDGSAPTCASATSPNPINVSASSTIKAIACKSSPAWIPSPIASASYTINGQLTTPAFSASPGLVSGIYSNEQTVTIASDPGTTIYYTLGDGTQAPPTCGTGNLGTNVVISNNANNIIKAIACRASFTDSNIGTSLTYTLKAAPPSPSVASGIFQTAQNIGFSSITLGSTIHLTHGTSLPADPNCSSATGNVPIPLNTATYYIKAIACKSGFSDSDIFTSAVYTVTGTVSSPSISGPAGVTNSVSLSSNTPPAVQTLCYKIGADPECSATNGGTPSNTGGLCASGTIPYTAPVPISVSSDFRTRACSNDYLASAVVQQTITISGIVGTVSFSPDPNTVADNDYTTTLTASGSSVIYYRTDGVNPDCTGAGATAGNSISISQNAFSIKAIGCAPLTDPSAVVTKTSNLQVAAPTLTSPASGGVFDNNMIAVWGTATTGANILYRIDASSPDCTAPGASGTYTFSAWINLPIAGSGGIHNMRVIGCKANYTSSSVTSSGFNFSAATPVYKIGQTTFSPTTATLPQTTLGLSSATTSTTICLLDTGSDPVCNTSGGCMVGTASSQFQHNTTGTKTVKAIACRTDYLNSGIETKTLTLDSPKLRIFVSETATDGNLPTANADALCNSDTGRPYTNSSYKAFRMGGGRNGTTDWVMLKGWSYYRADGTTMVGSSAPASAGWTGGTLANSIGTTAANIFTGIEMDGSGNFTESGVSCSGWTTNSGSAFARSGVSTVNTNASFSAGSNPCSTTSKLYCMEQPLGAKRIFLTNTAVLASVALSGADSACNSDANKPATGTYKALISTSARTPSTDWPLTANTLYLRPDNVTPIGITNASKLFSFPLTNSISAVAGTQNVFTGIDTGNNPWTTGANCSNFTDITLLSSILKGSSNATTSSALNDGSANCLLASALLYCVEQ
ncbi:FN3 associated domain-containing protein [Leptospira sp. 'Mane']|uniref:FN3 associated domain-containing protein n=1 Tax=Leptospira sp. 'Mane' TaxID=3387407 RepID=UPI00398B80E3